MFPWVLALAVLVLAIDQGTKYWAVTALSGGETVAVVGELIRFRLTYNSGAAFSIGAEVTWLFTIFTLIAVIATGVAAWRARSRSWTPPLGLLLGGATTHLLDRMLREPGPARGRVVDFIDYFGFVVGNVADIALAVGICWAVLLHLRGVSLTGAPGRLADSPSPAS